MSISIVGQEDSNESHILESNIGSKLKTIEADMVISYVKALILKATDNGSEISQNTQLKPDDYAHSLASELLKESSDDSTFFTNVSLDENNKEVSGYSSVTKSAFDFMIGYCSPTHYRIILCADDE